ncbi:MAG: dihydrodipicolinate synthase family protein [Actinobacteria bacterium 69-20]|nr:dihydrodipicolinate synthase family protein [Actinomycetota bacterium]OJV29013.1 MAG: dihydrodipicolinate synthase family protein [Actinobacteria bacterium 69-20]
MSENKPWRGVIVATALPLHDDLSIDYDGYAEHVAWLASQGVDGVAPNGSLGEYQNLTPEERAKVVEIAVQASPKGFVVMPGTGAYGAMEARRCAEQAAEAGAQVLMSLPPNTYPADERAVLEHYREIAKAGLPVSAYNNPFDTKVDLKPALLAKLYDEGLIVAVKEFSGDVRRIYEIAELAPGLDPMIGTDDTVLEVALAGGKGWIAGYTNVFPVSSMELFRACMARDLDTALPLYRLMHPLLRWDSKPEFIQAIKLSMDMIGRKGGRCRPPRQVLTPEQEKVVRTATEAAIAAGLH